MRLDLGYSLHNVNFFAMKTTFETVDSYIATFPDTVRPLLQQVRSTILSNAPLAVEKIAYNMPAYRMNGKVLVYFAAYSKHIGLYATPQGHEAFAAELSQYKQGKGSVQFPLDKAIPFDLIARIVAFRVQQVVGAS